MGMFWEFRKKPEGLEKKKSYMSEEHETSQRMDPARIWTRAFSLLGCHLPKYPLLEKMERADNGHRDMSTVDF